MADTDCIFCKIAAKEMGELVYEDDLAVAFRDLSPQAPVHILVVPKTHVRSLVDFGADGEKLAGHIVAHVVPELAKKFDLANGFRLVVNTGDDAQQTVKHLHFHILGGRKFAWPPG